MQRGCHTLRKRRTLDLKSFISTRYVCACVVDPINITRRLRAWLITFCTNFKFYILKQVTVTSSQTDVLAHYEVIFAARSNRTCKHMVRCVSPMFLLFYLFICFISHSMHMDTDHIL